MSLTDEEFREQHGPLHVPAAYKEAASVKDKIVFALADLGGGTAEQVIRHIEELDPEADHKPVIAATHEVLTRLYENGQLAANEKDGGLMYNLHKIRQANSGSTDQRKLAPGLD